MIDPRTGGPQRPAAIRPFEIAIGWVLACLLLGGASNAGALGNLALQVGAVAIVATTIWLGSPGAINRSERWLAWLFGAVVVWIALTLIPLPPAFWTALPGRGFVADGYRLLGLDLPWLPISLTDDRTVRGALSLLVPLATYLIVRPLDARQRLMLAGVVAAFAMVSVALGMAQLASGIGSPLRFYAVTNRTTPVGFFANTNHFVSLLLVASPLLFAAALGLRNRPKRGATVREWQPAILGCAALVGLGIVLSGSNAGIVLFVPSLAGALLIGPLRRFAESSLAVNALALAAGLAILVVGLSATTGLIQQRVGTSVTSRQQVTSTTLAASTYYLPVGSGLGSFAPIYLKHSGGEKSASEWMNHAHDDLAEVTLELGLPGILAIAGFAVWLLLATWRAWQPGDCSGPIERAAALGLVLVATHSLVDYPLRSAAMAAVFAMLLALLASVPPDRAEP